MTRALGKSATAVLLAAAAALLLITPGTGRSQQAPLAEAVAAARRLPRLHSLLVSHRGELVLEHYGSGRSAARAANVKSVSKSIIATLVGIALDRRLIPGLREPIVRWFPELARDPDPRKAAITIEDLVTMRAGLESTSGANYGQWVRSRNWVRDALRRPLVSAPGTAMEYSTGTSHILSAILTKASRMSTLRFAQTALGTPTGVTFAPWPRDPQGVYFGGNEMLMTPRQMVAFGELYLNGGKARGKQVVSAEWVAQSCVPRTVSRWDSSREYGYGWWIDEVGGRQACYAWGFGGQFIFVFRDLDLVVVTTSATDVSDERWDYRSELLALIETQVLAPIAARPAQAPSRQ